MKKTIRTYSQVIEKTIRQNMVVYFLFTDPAWSIIRKRFTVVDSGITRRVWAVNKRSYVYKLVKGRWRKVGGRLKHITSGQAGVWGVNSGGRIYFRERRRWFYVSGRLKQIDSGPKGIVCGVNKKNNIYCRTQITSRNKRGRGWVRVPGKLKYISCGEFGHWGVNKANNIYFREGVSRNNPAGLKWRKVPGKLKQLESGQYGQLWGVNRLGKMFVRTGVTERIPWGRGWKRVKTAKSWRCVSIGIGAVFGVGTNGRVYRTVLATGGKKKLLLIMVVIVSHRTLSLKCCNLCLTTAGIEPTTFGIHVQCSAN